MTLYHRPTHPSFIHMSQQRSPADLLAIEKDVLAIQKADQLADDTDVDYMSLQNVPCKKMSIPTTITSRRCNKNSKKITTTVNTHAHEPPATIWHQLMQPLYQPTDDQADAHGLAYWPTAMPTCTADVPTTKIMYGHLSTIWHDLYEWYNDQQCTCIYRSPDPE